MADDPPFTQADSYASIVTTKLLNKIVLSFTHPGDFPRVRVRLLESGDYGVSLQAFNPLDDNSVINVIYQV